MDNNQIQAQYWKGRYSELESQCGDNIALRSCLNDTKQQLDEVLTHMSDLVEERNKYMSEFTRVNALLEKERRYRRLRHELDDIRTKITLMTEHYNATYSEALPLEVELNISSKERLDGEDAYAYSPDRAEYEDYDEDYYSEM